MNFHLQEITDALQKINPILAAPESYTDEVQDMIEVISNSCITTLGMAHGKAKLEGFEFDNWSRQSNSFMDFLELYGEFCFHVTYRHMVDMDVDDMLVETLAKLRER